MENIEKTNKQKIERLYKEQSYKQNLEIKIFLKHINITNNIIQSKNKAREEKYKRFKERGKSLELARIKSEIMKLEKIYFLNNKHINNDIKYIKNKFIKYYK